MHEVRPDDLFWKVAIETKPWRLRLTKCYCRLVVYERSMSGTPAALRLSLSSPQKKLRQHIAMRSTIVQDIMIPYVENILPALFENDLPAQSGIVLHSVDGCCIEFAVYGVLQSKPQSGVSRIGLPGLHDGVVCAAVGKYLRNVGEDVLYR